MNPFAANPPRFFKHHTPRCEFKYQIMAEQVPALKAAIAPYCDVDPFVGDAGRYTITSLYLDTHDRRFYWATENQVHARMKLRVRTYGMNCEGPVFLEIKRRFGDAQSKSRVQVPRDHWQAAVLPGGSETFKHWKMDGKKMGVVKDFAAIVGGYALEPVCCVRYDRDPFVGRLNPDIRITFDQAMRAYSAHDWTLHPHDADYLPVDYPYNFASPEPRLVLEIKFDMRLPVWLIDLVRTFDLKREAYAKYVTSVNRLQDDHLRYRTDLRGPRWEV
ncbi:MAG: polyphosphate polymerase domain-containing protein [Deltaproteobacteria bacterium]|nr:polyphosphate polymerase domain-containing protein [Deltaproteobacteria bacterium]